MRIKGPPPPRRQPIAGVGAAKYLKIAIAAALVPARLGVIPAPAFAQTTKTITRRPSDFVDLALVAPAISIDMRYAGAHNFIGRPVPGYDAPRCLLTRAAANALQRVARALARDHLGLRVYDCYRPARAVNDFVRWAATPDADAMRPEFFPNVAKDALIPDGYIAAPSSHSRGSTVDLTLIPLPAPPVPAYRVGAPLRSCVAPAADRYFDGSLDLGTSFDCFDPLAHGDAAGIGAVARANRARLKAAMETAGFTPYAAEWWHFTLAAEPYPATWFDFPIAPARLAKRRDRAGGDRR